MSNPVCNSRIPNLKSIGRSISTTIQKTIPESQIPNLKSKIPGLWGRQVKNPHMAHNIDRTCAATLFFNINLSLQRFNIAENRVSALAARKSSYDFLAPFLLWLCLTPLQKPSTASIQIAQDRTLRLGAIIFVRVAGLRCDSKIATCL